MPRDYFMYDGGLTTGYLQVPVRWIFGKKPIKLNIENIEKYAKGSRELQPLDGRIILSSFY
jgi:carbonic anhydrase